MSAVISDCGSYRYTLRRDWAPPEFERAVFVMLNPSTADAEQDDPTIRRCINFARSWQCGGLLVLNLYALRSTDPKALWKHADPVGPDNDTWLRWMARARPGQRVVREWGANAKPERERQVVTLLRDAEAQLFCLDKTIAGAPKHPLYLAANTPLVRFGAAA